MDDTQRVWQPRLRHTPDQAAPTDIPEITRRAHSRLFLVMVAAGVALFAGLLSPQISYFGRGLRLALPAFAILLGFVLLTYKPTVIGQGILHNRYALSIGLGLMFVAMGFIRNSAEPRPLIFQNFILAALLNIMYLLAIILIKKVMPRALDPVRFLTLIVSGASLAVAIPLMVSEPGIMRDLQTMQSASASTVNISGYILQGVGNYTIYYAFAIGAPMIANWLYRQPRRLITYVGWCALILTSITVILSTLALAVTLLAIGMSVWVVLVIIKSRRIWILFASFLGAMILIPLMPLLFETAEDIEATAFVINKVTDTIEGVTESGVVEGDASGRGLLLEVSLESFAFSPFIGSWGVREEFFSGGHSSWVDSLVLFGIFGTLFYVIYLSPAWARRKPLSISDGAAGGTISWVLCMAAGVLNNTFYFSTILVVLWLYDDIYP